MSTPEAVKLKNPVTDRDHTSGSATAPVTLLQYGNFECIYCGQVYPIIKQVQDLLGQIQLPESLHGLRSLLSRLRRGASQRPCGSSQSLSKTD